METITEKIKRFGKRAVSLGKEGLERYHENLEVLSDSNKTIYTYKKTFYVSMEKTLKSEDVTLINWINKVMKMFSQIGFEKMTHSYDSKDDLNQITSITFDLERKVAFDPEQKQFWKQKLYPQPQQARWWEASEKRRQEEVARRHEAWKKDPYGSGMSPKTKQQPITPTYPIPSQPIVYDKTPSQLKGIIIQCTFTIFIDYTNESLQVRAVINYKDPQIIEMDNKMINNVITTIKLVIKDMELIFQ